MFQNNIARVVKALDKKYSLRKAEEWDSVGVQTSSSLSRKGPIVIALDLTTDILNFAIEKKAGLIITHHPLNFEKDEELEGKNNPYKKDIFERLKNTGIVHYVIHTNFDKSKIGMSKAMSEHLNLDFDKQLSSNFGFIAKLKEECRLNVFLETIKKEMELESLYCVNDLPINKLISKLAIIPGAGSVEAINEANKAGADVIVTSDIKWSTWILANEMNYPLVEVPHSLEKVFITSIFNFLGEKYKKMEIFTIYPKKLIKTI